jgi:ornithine cyclodeaminase
MNPTIFDVTQIRQAVTMPQAIEAMESAFAIYSRKEATVPPVMHLDIPQHRGEVHMKCGYIHGAQYFVLKVASGFYDNKALNLPVSSGMMILFDARTGFPVAILNDECYLTELRTAAAGAVAARHLAQQKVEQVAVLGAGSQGRFQALALASVRQFSRLRIYDHHAANVERYLADMKGKLDAHVTAADSVEEAVRGSQVVITATTSRQPLIQRDWVEPGTHITAMGSDDPTKQELQADVLARADVVVADSVSQCLRLGEIHHAVKAGMLREEEIDGELGDVIAGRIPGRTSNHQITVCDLTGVGVQDAAIAQLAYRSLTA